MKSRFMQQQRQLWHQVCSWAFVALNCYFTFFTPTYWIITEKLQKEKKSQQYKTKTIIVALDGLVDG